MDSGGPAPASVSCLRGILATYGPPIVGVLGPGRNVVPSCHNDLATTGTLFPPLEEVPCGHQAQCWPGLQPSAWLSVVY